MEKEEKVARLRELIMRDAGLTELTERQERIMAQAIYEGNIDLWTEKTINALDFCDKQEVEIKAFSYFMQKINYGNHAAIKNFRDWRTIKLRDNEIHRKMILGLAPKEPTKAS